MFNKLVFNSDNQFVLASNIIPDSHTGPEYTTIQLEDGETFDPQYTYSLIDGKAVKGDCIVTCGYNSTRRPVKRQCVR